MPNKIKEIIEIYFPFEFFEDGVALGRGSYDRRIISAVKEIGELKIQGLPHEAGQPRAETLYPPKADLTGCNEQVLTESKKG
jgi:hypothetical protein